MTSGQQATRPHSQRQSDSSIHSFAKHKRERMLAGLLHSKQQRRIETIQQVYKWIDSALQSELEGNTGLSQHLQERFGDLRGVMIDDRRACHVTVAGAAVLSAGKFGSFFMADSAAIALLFAEVGPPTLCLKR